MLVLTRKKDESIIIGDDIEIIITDISEDKVKIGIRAPRTLHIIRKELLEAVKDENINSTVTQKVDMNIVKDLIIKSSKKSE